MVEETKYDYAIKYLDELKDALHAILQRKLNSKYNGTLKALEWTDILPIIELMRAKITGDMILDKTNMLKENQDNGIKSR